MHNVAFYQGVLAELEKRAAGQAAPGFHPTTSAPATKSPGPAAPPAASTKAPAPTAPVNSTPAPINSTAQPYAPINHPGTTVAQPFRDAYRWFGDKELELGDAYKRVGSAIAYGTGSAAATASRIGQDFGFNSLKNLEDDYTNDQIATRAASGKLPESGQALNSFQRGYVNSSPNVRKDLNDPKTGIPSQTAGAGSYNPKTNSVDMDYSKVPGYMADKLEGLMSAHPWLTGLAGSSIIAMLLASLMKGSQQPQQFYSAVPSMGAPVQTAPRFL